jgi:hypothetical protein
MILVSQLIERYQGELQRLHGNQLLPSHQQALTAMRRCRRQGSDQMLLECKPCETTVKIPHSCGHRSCPHCQHHESQQWIERQTTKLLPVLYFMISFTVPAELRPLFWTHQKLMYDLLMKMAWQTIDSFARRDPKLKGKTGAHAVLHTHNRKLGYHPHVHLIVPAGVVDREAMQWRSKQGKYLFNESNLAKVFRAKMFDGIRRLGFRVGETIPEEWVVNCKEVGRGDKALIYLGRYLYRGVIAEKNILSDSNGIVTFRAKDNEGNEIIQSLPGGEFLWLLLMHVLPRRFRRVRDFGLLHGNAKKLILLVQLALSVRLPWPAPPREKTPILCPHCGGLMQLLAVRLNGMMPLLC